METISVKLCNVADDVKWTEKLAAMRDENIARAVELRQEGWSSSQIGELLGVSRQTAWRWLAGEDSGDEGTEPRPAPEGGSTAAPPARPPVPLDMLKSGSRPEGVDDEVDHGKLADRILNPSWRIR